MTHSSTEDEDFLDLSNWLKDQEEELHLDSEDLTDETALHFAVCSNSLSVAKSLIQKGADINARLTNGHTPLHEAVTLSNVEIVCLLLYYGADTNVKDEYGFTPFLISLCRNKTDILRILVEYEISINEIAVYRYSTLLLALYFRNSFALDLIDLGADINWVSDDGNNALRLSIFWDDAQLFKKIYPHFDCQLLLKTNKSFLNEYIMHCRFFTSEFMECLYMILESEVAVDLVRELSFKNLIQTFSKRDISKPERVAFIFTFLSLGALVRVSDVVAMHATYGFDEELEAFCLVDIDNTSKDLIHCSVPYYIFYPCIDMNLEALFSLPISQALLREFCCELLLYCTPSDTFKSYYLSTHCFNPETSIDHAFIVNRCITMSVVPSLTELSRNAFRKFLVNKYNINKSSWFFFVLKKLGIPKSIQEIICLKRPLYVV